MIWCKQVATKKYIQESDRMRIAKTGFCKKLASVVMVLVVAFGGIAPIVVQADADTSGISITIDGEQVVFTDQVPVIQDERTLVPVRDVFEAAGFDVDWNPTNQTVTMLGEKGLITIVVGESRFFSNFAYRELDVPAQIINGRTMLPIRALLESVGFEVDWDAATSTISATSTPLTQDVNTRRATSSLTPEEIEILHWITATAAILNYENHDNFVLLGRPRDGQTLSTVLGLENTLRQSWNVTTAAGLRTQIQALLDGGHNAGFLESARVVAEVVDLIGFEAASTQLVIAIADDEGIAYNDFMSLAAIIIEVQRFMDNTVYIFDRWGESGIVAWDMFRIGNLVSWGYVAGFIGFGEALDLMRPAIAVLQANFDNWDDAVANYLAGFAYWAGIDRSLPDTTFASRQGIFNMLNATEGLFDDALFASVPIGTRRGADGLYADAAYIQMLTRPMQRPIDVLALVGYWSWDTLRRHEYFFGSDGTVARVDRRGDSFDYRHGTFTLDDTGTLTLSFEYGFSYRIGMYSFGLGSSHDGSFQLQMPNANRLYIEGVSFAFSRSSGALFAEFYAMRAEMRTPTPERLSGYWRSGSTEFYFNVDGTARRIAVGTVAGAVNVRYNTGTFTIREDNVVVIDLDGVPTPLLYIFEFAVRVSIIDVTDEPRLIAVTRSYGELFETYAP